jgi:HSP20 family molecular chaperone IbpA
MKKKSFFERLTGGVHIDEDEYEEEEENDQPKRMQPTTHIKVQDNSGSTMTDWSVDEPHEGQLTVDVYQTPSHIIIKTLVAGVKRDDLDISISRDMVTIKGKREEERNIAESDYFHKELYWGAFSRTIMLPHEVDIDGAEATENLGMLIIRLPKIDKGKQTKLRVMKSLGN